MAHRHSVHKRAMGGRSKDISLRKDYTAPGSSKVEGEAESRKETFQRGGHAVGKAHGGRAKARADRRAAGGSVWSKAAGGLRGSRGHAGTPNAGGSSEHKHGGHAHHRKEGGRAFAAGGKVKGKDAGGAVTLKKEGGAVAKKAGGKVAKFAEGGKCPPEHEEDDGEEEEEGAKRGGRMHGGMHKDTRGMHYVGGKGKGGKHKKGGGHIDIYETHGGKHYWKDDDHHAKEGGRHWMKEAFAGSHGQFAAKAHKAGMSTGAYASKEAASPKASTKTKRQANLAKIGMKYGKH